LTVFNPAIFLYIDRHGSPWIFGGKRWSDFLGLVVGRDRNQGSMPWNRSF
jgi:hypothetical protein